MRSRSLNHDSVQVSRIHMYTTHIWHRYVWVEPESRQMTRKSGQMTLIWHSSSIGPYRIRSTRPSRAYYRSTDPESESVRSDSPATSTVHVTGPRARRGSLLQLAGQSAAAPARAPAGRADRAIAIEPRISQLQLAISIELANSNPDINRDHRILSNSQSLEALLGNIAIGPAQTDILRQICRAGQQAATTYPPCASRFWHTIPTHHSGTPFRHTIPTHHSGIPFRHTIQ